MNIIFVITNTNNGDSMKVLITGATSGIGYLTGITLADRGHKVIMTTRTDNELEILNEKISKLKLKNIGLYKLNILNDEDINKINFKELDVIINNAAIGVGGSIIDLEIDKIKENFEVNYFSTIKLSKLFCNEKIKNNKKGKIIVISSIAGYIPIEFLGSYCSTKSALISTFKCLRKELNLVKKDIEICLVVPGAYKTGFNQLMIDSVFNNIKNDSIFYKIKSKIYNKLNIQFCVMEKRKLDSIVCQIIYAVENNKNKLFYTAPFIQNLVKKIYLLIYG